MSVYFSDNLAVSTANTTLVGGFKATVGIKHARMRVSIARISALALTTDTIRMITLKSSDRLWKLQMIANGGSAAGAVDVGLYLAGSAHDGAEVDADLFASAVTISSAIDFSDAGSDVFDESDLAGTDRGKAMWALGAIGDGSDTSDPNVAYDIVITPSTSFTTTVSIITLFATYTSGD